MSLEWSTLLNNGSSPVGLNANLTKSSPWLRKFVPLYVTQLKSNSTLADGEREQAWRDDVPGGEDAPPLHARRQPRNREHGTKRNLL